MEESKLVKGKKLPTAKEVAEYGYKAMMDGKVVAIHGLKSKLLVFGSRFSPRFLVLKIARYLQGK